jgi:hypothetical protein
MRRIKAVSVSIPAVTGPYSGVTCKMSLLNNRFRKSTSASSPYNYQDIDDLRFIHNIIGIQSIATSTGNNDTGMFEFNFRDERYLPFEGAGAIGKWQIELPNAIRKFDYESISDVILHVKYTARDAGGLLKTAAENNILANISSLMNELAESGAYLVTSHCLQSEFADEIYELVHNETATLKILKKHFPNFIEDILKRHSGATLTISSIILLSKANLSDYLFDNDCSGLTDYKHWVTNAEFPGLYLNTVAVPDYADDKWSLTLDADSYDGKDDVYLFIKYTVSIP